MEESHLRAELYNVLQNTLATRRNVSEPLILKFDHMLFDAPYFSELMVQHLETVIKKKHDRVLEDNLAPLKHLLEKLEAASHKNLQEKIQFFEDELNKERAKRNPNFSCKTYALKKSEQTDSKSIRLKDEILQKIYDHIYDSKTIDLEHYQKTCKTLKKQLKKEKEHATSFDILKIEFLKILFAANDKKTFLKYIIKYTIENKTLLKQHPNLRNFFIDIEHSLNHLDLEAVKKNYFTDVCGRYGLGKLLYLLAHQAGNYILSFSQKNHPIETALDYEKQHFQLTLPWESALTLNAHFEQNCAPHRKKKNWITRTLASFIAPLTPHCFIKTKKFNFYGSLLFSKLDPGQIRIIKHLLSDPSHAFLKKKFNTKNYESVYFSFAEAVIIKDVLASRKNDLNEGMINSIEAHLCFNYFDKANPHERTQKLNIHTPQGTGISAIKIEAPHPQHKYILYFNGNMSSYLEQSEIPHNSAKKTLKTVHSKASSFRAYNEFNLENGFNRNPTESILSINSLPRDRIDIEMASQEPLEQMNRVYFDYPGYGLSLGHTHTKKDFYQSAFAVAKHMIDTDPDANYILLHGMSVGGMVATKTYHAIKDYCKTKGRDIQVELYSALSFSSTQAMAEGALLEMSLFNKGRSKITLFSSYFTNFFKPLISLVLKLTNWDMNALKHLNKIPDDCYEVASAKGDLVIGTYASVENALRDDNKKTIQSLQTSPDFNTNPDLQNLVEIKKGRLIASEETKDYEDCQAKLHTNTHQDNFKTFTNENNFFKNEKERFNLFVSQHENRIKKYLAPQPS